MYAAVLEEAKHGRSVSAPSQEGRQPSPQQPGQLLRNCALQGLGNRTEGCTIYTAAHNQGDGTMLCGTADSPEG